jgi:Zn-dependent membrane protease YugP
VGFVLPLVTSAAYEIARSRLDQAHPDTLPTHAGAWLREQLERRSLSDAIDVRIDPSEKRRVDAFSPSGSFIVLSQLTYCKADPSFWAVAAHELGHALVYRSSWLVAAIFSVARQGSTFLLGLAGTLAFSNILFRSQVVNQVLMAAALAGFALELVVLIDEALASVRAMAILGQDERLGRRELRGAGLTLLVAFGTYLVGAVGTGIFVVERDVFIRALALAPPFEPGPLPSTFRLILLAVLTLLVSWLAARELRILVHGEPAHTLEAVQSAARRRIFRDVIRGATTLSFVALAYDMPFGLAFVFACVFAIRSSLVTVLLLAMPPMAVCSLCCIAPVLMALAALTMKYARDEQSAAFDAATASSHAEVIRSQDEFRRAALALHNDPPWTERTKRFAVAFGALPMVVLFWVLLAAR